MRRIFAAAVLTVPLVFAGSFAVAAPRAALPESYVAHGTDDVCNYTNLRPSLARGSSGSAVQQAQCYLNSAMSDTDLAEDGDFGPQTAAAVRQFQSCADIIVDGRIGAQTWSFLVFWANSDASVC